MSKTAKQKNKSGRWLKVSGTIIAVIALVLVLLPLGIEWGAEKWLRDNGATQAEVADVDLNLFTGRVAVYGLEAGVAEGRTLKVAIARLEVNWQALFKQRIELERIELIDAVIDVRPLASEQTPGGVAVGELVFISTPTSAAAEPKPESDSQSDWGVGVNALVVNNVVINHLDPTLNNQLQINHLEIGLLASWLKDKPIKLLAELQINGASFHLDSQLLPFKQTPEVTANIRLRALNLKNYAALIEPAGLLKPAGELELDLALEVSYKDERELSLRLAGSVALADLHAELDDIVIEQKMLRWQGQVSYLLDLTHSAAASLASEGEVTLKALNIQDKKSGLTLLDLAQAEFKQIKVAELDHISIAGVSLTQLQALKKTSPDDGVFVTLEQVRLNGIALSEMKHVAIDEITLEQLAVDVMINKEGEVALLSDLAPSPSEPVTDQVAVVEEKKEDAGFTFEIAQLKITKNSAIKFVDNSVVPVYQMDISPLELTLKKINSAAPEQATELDLNMGLGKYASFSLAGTLQPFAEKITSQLKGELKSLDLPPLSSYSGKYMGYHLQRGRLDTQLDIKIIKDELDVNNTLVLRKLLLEEMDGEAAKGFAEKLGMPLNAALDLLRDGDDNIEFDLPVTGNLNDPKFELSGVMKLALTKGMQMAAMSYIKNALQPLGTIMLVSDLVGKVTALKFQPLVFDAGSAGFNDEGQAYLEKLATVLNDRPNLQLTLCGVSTPADQQVLEAQRQAVQEGDEEQPAEIIDIKAALFDLASQRGELVKSYFINQQKISPERLFACNAKFVDEEDVAPSVEISL